MKPTGKCTAIGAADLGLTWQSPKASSARGGRPDGALMPPGGNRRSLRPRTYWKVLPGKSVGGALQRVFGLTGLAAGEPQALRYGSLLWGRQTIWLDLAVLAGVAPSF